MTHSIAPGVVPPQRGLEKEEPEFWEEEDIPTSNNSSEGADEIAPQKPPASDVERE